MEKMPITMLNGLGCASCGGTCGQKSMMGLRGLRGLRGFGAVADYDVIRIGGGSYSVNQIIGKTIFANKQTTLYSNPSGGGRVVGTIKAGQPIGVVFSYIKPTDKTSDGRAWLQFDNSYLNSFFIPDENASSAGLKDQGTMTVSEEVKAEADAKLKEDSPMEYYIKKYGTKALLIVGGLIVAVSLGKELIHTSRSKPEPAPALTGPPRKRKTKTKK